VFDQGMMIIGVPIAFLFSFASLTSVNLLKWVYETRLEAKRKGFSFRQFIETPEYKAFLAAYAAKIIEEQIRW